MSKFGAIKDISPGQRKVRLRCRPPVWKLATVSLFLILTLLPSIVFIIHHIDPGVTPQIDIIEMRDLRAFPPLSPGAWRDLPAQIDAWWSDYFGFRNSLVLLNNETNIKITGVSPVKLVVIGKEGWLFYTGDQAMQDYQGLVPLSDGALSQITANLEARRTWLEAHNSQYLIVVAPNKQTVYGQYLPDWTNRRVGPTRLDQLESALGPHSDISLLDLRTLFLNQASSFHTPYGIPVPLYYKTDTHWNSLGAFLAFQAMIAQIHNLIPGFEYPVKPDFSQGLIPRPGGDLAGMLGMAAQFPDGDATIDPAYFKIGPKSNLKVLVFWDSFYMALKPFLINCFDQVVETPQRSLPVDYTLVEKEKPDLVIDLFTERYLTLRLSPP